MDSIIVHPRIFERHPEISEKDVRDAWAGCIKAVPRFDRNPNEYIAIGCDSNGRLLEMIAVITDRRDWLVFHAFTPPTHKALKELGMTGR